MSEPVIGRRAILGGLGIGAVGVAGGIGYATRVAAEHRDPSAGNTGITVESWAAERGSTWFIAHRGSGDVFPEHSMAAYQGAAGWGARCIEVSVGMTSDKVLVCMHDPTYDRTTNAKGQLASQPATILRSVAITQPQLGPAWTTEPLPRVPLLDEVLRTFGGRSVLAVEAKNEAAYPAMMDMIEGYGLRESVIVKAPYGSPAITAAKQAGYPVFGYLGATELTPAGITSFAALLDPQRDLLVIPSTGADGALTPTSLVQAAVATGIPVGVYPLHRRVEVARLRELGVKAMICSSYGYLVSDVAVAVSDTWASKAVAAGEMKRSPGSTEGPPIWTGADELTLAATGTQQFMTLGQLSPVAAAAGSYHVTFDVSWTALPTDRASNITLAFGHADDAYYEHRWGKDDGYHAILRADGRLELYLHRAGTTAGVPLISADTPAPVPGKWIGLRLDVTPTTLAWTRTDVATPRPAAVNESTIRGGYLHIGRSSADGVVAFRHFDVT